MRKSKNKFNFFKNKKGPFVIRAFFILVMSVVGTRSMAASGQEVIKTAEKLTLEAKRGEALVLLKESAIAELDLEMRRQLIKKLESLSEIFYTEDSQKKYSAALSVAPKDPETALKKLRALLITEPDNARIEVALARILLREKKCSSALSLTSPTLEKKVFLKKHLLTQLQAQLCMSDIDGFFETNSKLVDLDKVFKADMDQSQWECLGHIYMKIQDRVLLSELIKKHSFTKSTEWPLFNWFVEQKSVSKKTGLAQKYMEICRNKEDSVDESGLGFIFSCDDQEQIKNYLEDRGQPEVKGENEANI